MRIKYEDIRKEIIQRAPDGWDAVTELLYQFYSNTEADASSTVKEALQVMEACTQVLSFKEADQVCTAATSMCVEYERAAFTEGMLLGARILLDLVGQ